DFQKTLAGAAYQPLASWLDAHAVARNQVAAGTVYTVHPVTAVGEALRDQVDALPAPVATANAQFSYIGSARLDTLLASARAHSHMAAAINGTFRSPYYLADSPDKLGYFNIDAQGKPVPKTTVDVPFTLVLPAGV